MSVALRLKVIGTKHRPIYRVVAVDSRKARDGRTLANLGHYNPLTEPAEICLDEERVLNYLKCGAQPSDTVRQLLLKKGIRQTPIKQENGTKLAWAKVG
ncbi:MAG: SSU ribosomal protein S16p [Candidatus Ozemobacter sibiricus]|jgi:small subunit ribosomal protein S16|uniref:Small ribosomal subunit protein bS16 n=1 Tax=Candidatus Ozemobacter sibiricus TaxID=2268124 RepID=A0A367ZP96_9BACT|nr:MAG: SSU ribosomal protein S16p [Candidatus Ozemobacter sibiricus]